MAIRINFEGGEGKNIFFRLVDHFHDRVRKIDRVRLGNLV